MKLLVIARHCSYLRNFETAIRALAARGHRIHLAVERDEQMGGRDMIGRVIADYPNVSLGRAPAREADASREGARLLRLGLDYLRFRDPLYERTPHLRARAEERAPAGVVRAAALPGLRRRPGRVALGAALGWLERGIPPSEAITRWLSEQAPDVVLLTPLVELGSPQIDYLVAAKALGLRTALGVGSWDHLSSKALIRDCPDRVLVWNPTQRDEAIRMHGVPADRIVVTGAQAYDHWFTWQPTRTREAFCRHVGLPGDRPFILYVCSSLFKGTADESVFVEKWIRSVRGSNDPVLRGAGILIRPHPGRMDEWVGFDFGTYPDVAFRGQHPIDDESRADYFESMKYSAAVVGLNTSAFLEAAIVGRPVHTVLLPKYSRNNQEGTIHFHYLLDAGGGLLHVARSFQEHTGQLAKALREPIAVDPQSARFVDTFIRPFGRDVAAAPRFADAMEALASGPAPAPRAETPADRLARRVLPSVVSRLGRSQRNAKKDRAPLPSERRAEAARVKKREAVSGPSPLAPRVGKARAGKVLTGSDTAEARDTRAHVERIAGSGRPILVGPWVSEAGFELLYWIPFLAWAKQYGRLDPARLVVVSRGGARPWYQGVAEQYADVFSFWSPEEFRALNEQRIVDRQGVQKHLDLAPLDRQILDRVAAERGIAEYDVLHPSLMYTLFQLFWRQHQPITILELFTSFALTAPSSFEPDVRPQLPAKYIAAKFYGNVALPDTPENAAFVRSTLAALSSGHDVVLLTTGVRFDDHAEFTSEARGRLHTIDHLMTPETNLAVQTAVIRHADAYVGTYGGFSYLAPLVGTDAVTFFSHPGGFRWDHLEVAKRVFAALGAGGFTEVDVRHLRAIEAAFGGLRGAGEPATRA